MTADLFQSSQILCVAMDSAHSVLRVNKAFRMLFPGLDWEGTVWADVLAPESKHLWASLTEKLERKMIPSQSFQLEHIPRKGKKLRLIQWEIHPSQIFSGSRDGSRNEIEREGSCCYEYLLIGVDKTKEIIRKEAIDFMEIFQQSYIDSTNSLVFIKDREGRYTGLNSSMEELLGKERSFILGKRDEEILGDPMADMLRESERQVLEGQEMLSSIEKFSDDLIYEFYRFPIVHDGDVVGLGGIAVDVTMQIQTQINLSQKIEENNAIISAIPDLVFIVDEDLKFVDFNSKNPDELFLNPDDFLNRSIHEVLPGYLSAKTEWMITESKRKGKIQISEYHLEIKNKKQYYEARCVNFSGDRYLFLIRNITTEKREAIELQNDLDMARDLQYSTLPKTNSMNNDFLGISIVYKPLSNISGDIYDFFEIRPNVYRYVIIDAVGHGIQSSLLTMALRTELERVKSISDLSPGQLLAVLNRSLSSTFKSRDNTCSCCVVDIDITNQKITYSSAGHPIQFYKKSNDMIEGFGSRAPLVGLLDEYPFQDKQLEWSDEFDIFLFTDGIFEFVDWSDELYSEEKLMDMVEIITRKSSFKNQKKLIAQEIYNSIIDIAKHSKLRDDLTLLHIFNR